MAKSTVLNSPAAKTITTTHAATRTLVALSMTLFSLGLAGSTWAQPSLYGGRFLEQDTGFIPDTSEAGDAFGSALATGDFNCDGHPDLAIGVANEDLIGGHDQAGQVTVIFGSEDGLDATTSVFWSQSLGLLPGGGAGDNHQFGAALAAGNFNNFDFQGRPCDDLAIGVPGMPHISGTDDTGGVIVIPGHQNGFIVAGARYLSQGSFSSPEPGDEFGAALAAGDFNGDGFDDLAIGAPGEDIPSGDELILNVGEVNVIYGSEFGLSAADAPALQAWQQDDFGAAREAGDRFGEVLVAGDFNRATGPQTYDELAIGIPEESVGALDDAGAVIVVNGSIVGLDASQAEIFTQDTPGVIGGGAAVDNRFGFSLAAGDFDDDGADDLAVGSPGLRFVAGFNDVGGVHVLWGVSDGADLTTVNDRLLWRNSFFSTWDSDELFGYALATADFDGDGRDDLAVSAPGADIDAHVFAGVAHTLLGHAGKNFDAGATLFQTAGLGAPETTDFFAMVLAAEDFDGNGLDDLAAGVPLEGTPSGDLSAGAVNLFIGGVIFADGFESGDLSAWSLSSP